MKENNKCPWMGFKPYTEEDAQNFKGREAATIELLDLVENNAVSVCYAESGTGKSSLINAGLIPVIRRKGYFPVQMRFDFDALNSVEEKESNPAKEKNPELKSLLYQQILACISSSKNEFNNNNKSISIKWDIPEKNNHDKKDKISLTELWETLRTRPCLEASIEGTKMTTELRPILIFDQFEKLLYDSNKHEVIESFFDTLKKLVINLPPLDGDSEFFDEQKARAESDYNSEPFKVLVSIRHEFMGILDYWCTQLVPMPSLHDNRYFLRALTLEQAKEVITKQDTDLLEDIANDIVEKVKEGNSVSAILLSVYCSSLWERAKVDGAGNKIRLSALDFTKESSYDIIKSYYLHQLSQSGVAKKKYQEIERLFVTDDGKRRIQTLEDCERHGITKEDVEALDKSGIVHRYDFRTQRFVELIHDRVGEVVKDIKAKRKNKRTILLAQVATVALTVSMLIFAAWYGSWHYDPLSDVCANRNLSFTTTLDTINNDKISISGSKYPQLAVLSAESEKVTLSDSRTVNTIRVGAKTKSVEISNCPNLAFVVFEGDSITSLSIGECPGVRKLSIPSSVVYLSIGENVYLSSILSDNPSYKWIAGNLYYNGIVKYSNSKILEYRTTDNIVVDSFLVHKSYCDKIVSGKCFSDSLDFNVFKNSVDVENYAFYGNNSIRRFVLPDSNYIYITKNSFSYMEGLEEVEISRELPRTRLSLLFLGCKNNVVYDVRKNPHLSIEDGVIYLDTFKRDDSTVFAHVPWGLSGIKSYPKIELENGYFSKGGALLLKDSLGIQLIDAPKEVDVKELNSCIPCHEVNGIFFCRNWVLNASNNQARDIYISLWMISKEGYCFQVPPIGLETIHIPQKYPIPECNHINLPDSVLNKITLFVPYGCRQNFIYDKYYQRFRDIREDSQFQSLKNTIENSLHGIIFYLSIWYYQLAIIILLTFVWGLLFIIKYTKDRQVNRNNPFRSALAYSILILLIGIESWIALYWTFWFVFEINDNILCSIVAGVLAVTVMVIVSINTITTINKKNLTSDIKRSIKALKEQIKKSFKNSVRHRKQISMYFVCLLVVVIIVCSVVRDCINSRQNKLEFTKHVVEVADSLSQLGKEEQQKAFFLLSEYFDDIYNVSDSTDLEIESLVNSLVKPLELEAVCLREHKESIRDLFLDVSSNTLYSASDDKTIRKWNLETLVCEDSLTCRNTPYSLLEHDGLVYWAERNKVLNGSFKNMSTKAWDVEVKSYWYRKLLGDFKNKKLIGLSDNEILIWNLESNPNGNYKVLSVEHKSDVTEIAFDDKMTMLASCDENKHFIVRSYPKTDKIIVNDSLENYISTVAFSPNGTSLAFAGNNDVCIYNINDKTKVYFPKKSNGYINKLCFTQDGQNLLIANNWGIELWDISSDPVKMVYKYPISTTVNAICLSNDSKHFFSGEYYGTIRIWNLSGKISVQEALMNFRNNYKDFELKEDDYQKLGLKRKKH